jgi:hypothetical protein
MESLSDGIFRVAGKLISGCKTLVSRRFQHATWLGVRLTAFQQVRLDQRQVSMYTSVEVKCNEYR